MKNLNFKLWLFAIMLCTITSASAHDFEVGGIYYKITSITKMTVAVTYRGDHRDLYDNEYTGSVVIPETVTYNGKTYSVTLIGDDAFDECKGLTSVTIPNSVTSIGESAFFGCRGLISVTIPENLTKIGSEAFDGCKGLSSVHISNLAAWCGISFYNRSSNPFYYANHFYLNGEEVTDLVIPNSVTSIGDYVFSGCEGITSVTIPESVTSIGRSAFMYCSGLTSVTIPNSVTSIGDDAFYGCSGLTSVPESVTSIANNIELNSESEMVKKEHEYVDLGLPSGTLWATTNIGAENPEDVGGYFAWGETICNKENYSWVTYKWYGKVWRYDNVYENNKFTKYCDDWNYGNPDNLLELELCDDAAYTLWGSEWRIPSYDDYSELFYKEHTILEEGELNGKPVYQIKSKINGNTIYLPMGGTLESGSYSSPTDPNYLNAGEPFNSDNGWSGNYWTRNLGRKKNGLAYCLILRTRKQTRYGCLECIPESRYVGCNIRPVRVKK